MKTPTHVVHPLVEKAAREWVDLAAEYGIRATVERGETWCEPDAVAVKIDTGDPYEHCTIVIYPPMRPGRAPRQAPVLSRYYRSRGGKLKYGAKPGTTLRDARLWLARSSHANRTKVTTA